MTAASEEKLFALWRELSDISSASAVLEKAEDVPCPRWQVFAIGY